MFGLNVKEATHRLEITEVFFYSLFNLLSKWLAALSNSNIKQRFYAFKQKQCSWAATKVYVVLAEVLHTTCG